MFQFDGPTLAALRQQRGITQRALGVKVGIREATAQQIVSSWEQRGVVPNANQLILLAAALNCTMADFFSAAHTSRSGDGQDTQQDTEPPAAGAA